ncbi:hypothetical protein PRIPAC_73443 [Pristionchus pacificus]|nr:hypothetical protein PRIPAC_73443 [Pristionchus pacificus]
MYWVLSLLLLLPYSINAIEGYKNYSGYQIFQLSPQTDKHLEYIGKLDEGLGFELDVLRAVNKIGSHSEVLVPPGKINHIIRSLTDNNITYEVAVDDVGAIVARERRALANPNPGTFDPFHYYSYEDQMKYLDFVASRRFSFVTQGIIGYSSERRPIKFLRIGFPSRQFKPSLVIEAGIHAREWIAPATALHTIHELTTDGVYENLLKTIDIYIIPNTNPDGYEYSRLHDRLWRKTRSGPRGPQRCFGTDGNRNFPYFYAFDGTSRDPCSDIFHGDGPLSEPEAAGLSRFLLAHKKTIRGFISLHSYGGNILYPWGHKKRTYPEDVRDLIWAGNRMAAAIEKVHGTKYKVENSADGLYPAAGATDDYAKSIGIKYTFTMELRPTDSETLAKRGFELPPQEIKGAAEEAFEGIVELAIIIRNERMARLNKSPSPRPLLPLVKGKTNGIARRKPFTPIQSTVSRNRFSRPIVSNNISVRSTKSFSTVTPSPSRSVVRTVVRVPTNTVVRRPQRDAVSHPSQTLSSGKI